jgi:hypothetical protein
MPSIFVWKTSAASSSETIRCLIGADWYTEEHLTGTITVQYTKPHRFDNVVMWNAQFMPASWTGSYLLDIVNVPYHLIKKDSYATLERVGNWMRCTMTTDIDPSMMKQTYEAIKEWSTPDKPCSVTRPLSHKARPFQPMR